MGIMDLAIRVFEERLTLEAALNEHVPRLIHKGLDLSETLGALQLAIAPETPSLLASHIGHIYAAVTAGATFKGPLSESIRTMIGSSWNPGVAHLIIADSLDARPDRQSLQLAAEHYRAARRTLVEGGDELGVAFLHEGEVRRKLAELGVDPVYNLDRAIEYATRGRGVFADGSSQYGIGEMNEAIARDVLAHAGVETKTNLLEAQRLYQSARTRFPEGSELYHQTEFNEAACCVYLAEHVVEPLATLSRAVRLCESARRHFPPDSQAYGLALLNEGNARRGLAEWDERAIENLEHACLLFAGAQGCFDASSYDWRISVEAEVGARRELAEHGQNAVSNLTTGFDKLITLRGPHSATPLALAEHDIQEADLHVSLARHGDAPIARLETAVVLFARARTAFDPTGRVHARAATGEGNARLLMAMAGVNPIANREEALALFEASAVPHETGTTDWAVAQRNAARALWSLGSITEASERIEAGIAVLEQTRGGLRSERERITFAEIVAGQFQDAAAICLTGMRSAREPAQRTYWCSQAWHHVHRAKNRVLLDYFHGGRPRLGAHQTTLWTELETLAAQLVDCEKERPAGDCASLRDRLAAKRSEVLVVIEGAETFVGVDVPPAQEVRAAMRQLAVACGGAAQRTLLVEFFTLDDGRLLVFLVPLWMTDVVEIEEIPLPPGRIKRLALDVLRTTRHATRAPAEATYADEIAGQQLDAALLGMQAVVGPCVARIEEWQPTELVISAHAHLNLLPLHAVAFAGKPLIEWIPVAYLPSPALAPLLRARLRTSSDTALLVGDVGGDLAHARAEVESVADKLQRAGMRVTKYLGADVTAARVTAGATTARILHFACHAGLQHDDFLRSGLALGDRRLTVLEMMASLELARADLAYLSACDSALPVVGHTEELMALARAFFYAGSPTVIATLWPLDDMAGRVFAGHFYDAWPAGGASASKIHAFQQAMLKTRIELPDPVCWAPFTLMGAW